MAESQSRSASPSLKVAVFTVDAVWYLTWVVAALGLTYAAAVVTFPQLHDRLVREGARVTLPFEVRYEAADRPPTGSAGGDGVRLIGHDDVVMARPFGRGDLAGYIVSRLAVLALFLFLLYQLRALMHAVKRGHPFDPANPKRIRRIAYVIIASGPAFNVLQWLEVGLSFQPVLTAVRRALPGATVGYDVQFDGWQLVVLGLIVLAIAHAFDAGVRLQNDQDLTV